MRPGPERGCGWGHPRSRGEHSDIADHFARWQGSSPLARGTQDRWISSSRRFRVIPARAGNTRRGLSRSRVQRGHPRSRGEHVAPLFKGAAMSGSSPLARGTLGVPVHHMHQVGVIPARAGNTHRFGPVIGEHGGHPRSRGEHLPEPADHVAWLGSSPLARGTRCGRCGRRGDVGVIPARAGNTVALYGAFGATRGHPRSRGEHRHGGTFCASHGGSSPLARGTPMLSPAGRDRNGVIPARAGNTRCRRGTGRSYRGHPRSRGEHILMCDS